MRVAQKRHSALHEHPFERALSVSVTDLCLEFTGHQPLIWADFLLNPRRLRGSDFLMRWSQGVWSEERIKEAVNKTGKYFALAYGPSGTAPDNDVRAFELYFERLEHAGLGKIKRPDLLIFKSSDRQVAEKLVTEIGGEAELPFTLESDQKMSKLLSLAVLAIEAENSLWEVKMMPAYGTPLTPQKRLGGKLGLKKTAVVPTVIVKEEDRAPLLQWQKGSGVKIHVWHCFYDLAYGIALDDIEKLIKTGAIEPTVQTYQAPGGANTKKIIYKIYYHHAYPLGQSNTEPNLTSAFVKDKNGHILPYVKFEGGTMTMSSEALKVLEKL